jgi:large subunit ribosomal protein L5
VADQDNKQQRREGPKQEKKGRAGDPEAQESSAANASAPEVTEAAETGAPVAERAGGASELTPSGRSDGGGRTGTGRPADTARSDGARQNGKTGPARKESDYVPRLRSKYVNEVVPAMIKQFGYSNVMQVPHIEKVVINIGMGGEARENAKALDNAVNDVGIITGQKAVITRAKKSIAAFKLRTGMPIGVMVTLRGNRMYDFLDKLFNVSLARVRDFSGVSPKSFDGHGNFSLGLREQLIFPEIDYDKIDRVRGMEIVIVTSANNDEEGRQLLQLLGMPFRR